MMNAPVLDLDKLHLESGSHTKPKGPDDVHACVMEAVSYIAGEPWSDHPKCASPIITSFLIGWNDALPDQDRQMLKPYIPRLVGTRTTAADERTRAWLLTDWLARECAPAWLRLAGLTVQAEQLEALVPLVDAKTARAAQPTLDIAKTDAAAAWAAAWGAARAAAWDAARAAARAAAWDAAWDAAWAAAWAAAWDAAWAAAWAAARDAAWAAARDAARAAARDAAEKGGNYDAQYAAAYKAAKPLVTEKFDPTVRGLQQSALLLLDRLIEVGRPEAA